MCSNVQHNWDLSASTCPILQVVGLGVYINSNCSLVFEFGIGARFHRKVFCLPVSFSVPLFSLVLSGTLPSLSDSLCSFLAPSQEPGLMLGLLLCGNIALNQKHHGPFLGVKLGHLFQGNSFFSPSTPVEAEIPVLAACPFLDLGFSRRVFTLGPLEIFSSYTLPSCPSLFSAF